MPSETDVWGVRGHLGPLMQIKEEKWGTTEMNKPLKCLQGWTAPSETLISITQISVWWRAGCLHRKEAPEARTKNHFYYLHVCVIMLMTWVGKTWTHNAFHFRFCHKMCTTFFFYQGFWNFWRPCFGCRCVMWHASCVESLFPLLLGYLLCSDMFLSPSPKFPSFRERSEARDCDPPWGWVKDSSPPSLPWEKGCSSSSLYFVYTWVPFSLLDHLTMCRKSRCIMFPALFWIVQMDQ